jgi:hypothetical protein
MSHTPDSMRKVVMNSTACCVMQCLLEQQLCLQAMKWNEHLRSQRA